MQFLEIESLAVHYKRRQRDTSQVADRDFIWTRVLDNFRAQIAALDGTQVLLVRLAVAGVLVQHEWTARLCLSFQNGIPQLLRLDRLAGTAFALISLIQLLHYTTAVNLAHPHTHSLSFIYVYVPQTLHPTLRAIQALRSDKTGSNRHSLPHVA